MPPLPEVTLEEKIAELEREIIQRHRAYKWMISKGKLKPEEANRRIRIMSAVKTDYENKAKEGPLFNEGRLA